VRAQRLSTPSRERRNHEEHEYPLDPGHGRTVGLGTPSHFSSRVFGGRKELFFTSEVTKPRSAESQHEGHAT
jgi:hypothetical protein